MLNPKIKSKTKAALVQAKRQGCKTIFDCEMNGSALQKNLVQQCFDTTNPKLTSTMDNRIAGRRISQKIHAMYEDEANLCRAIGNKTTTLPELQKKYEKYDQQEAEND
jgi:precorrin isomerase